MDFKDRMYEVVSASDIRTIIKHGTAIAVEAILFKKACSVGYRAVNEVIPVVRKIVDPRVRYIALEGTGEVTSLRSLSKNPLRMVKELRLWQKSIYGVELAMEKKHGVESVKLLKQQLKTEN
jgi:hypothetical protein